MRLPIKRGDASLMKGNETETSNDNYGLPAELLQVPNIVHLDKELEPSFSKWKDPKDEPVVDESDAGPASIGVGGSGGGEEAGLSTLVHERQAPSPAAKPTAQGCLSQNKKNPKMRKSSRRVRQQRERSDRWLVLRRSTLSVRKYYDLEKVKQNKA